MPVIIDADQRYRVADDVAFYRWQRVSLQQLATAQQLPKPREPWRYLGPLPVAWVSAGRLVLQCVCGAGCMVRRATGLALCGECGAIYEGVVVPDPQAWQDLEDVMSVRPEPERNNVDETLRFRGPLAIEVLSVDALDRENQDHRGYPSLAEIRRRRGAERA